ncbi:MAG TPA: hypothetical protein VFI97_03645 [Arthrobacter sp.]|nr:hypothetical protein [Arthrobacter sp.]
MTGFQNPVTDVSVVGGVAVNNPADIGLSTAQQANALGIPQTFQGSRIVNVRIPTTGVTSYTLSPDMSAYSGLSINLFEIGLAQAVTFTWLDASGGNVISQHSYLATGSYGTPPTGANLQVRLPVEAPTLRIDFPRGSSTVLAGTGITVYASNRSQIETVANIDLGVDFQLSQAWNTTTAVLLGTVMTNGGAHWARMLTNGSGSAYFGYQTWSGGALKNIFVYKTAVAQDAYSEIFLPRGCVGLYVLSAVAATFAAEFSVTPQ